MHYIMLNESCQMIIIKLYCVEKIARGILDAIKGTKKTTLFTISSTVPLRVKNKLIIVRLFKTHSLIFFVLDNIGSILVD